MDKMEQAEEKDGCDLRVRMPKGLHQDTRGLVAGFAKAMADKLYAAQEKYGYGNEWSKGDWLDTCRAKLREHMNKGDPRDVANYCAFLWFHGEPTVSPKPETVEIEAMVSRLRRAVYELNDVEAGIAEREIVDAFRALEKR